MNGSYRKPFINTFNMDNPTHLAFFRTTKDIKFHLQHALSFTRYKSYAKYTRSAKYPPELQAEDADGPSFEWYLLEMMSRFPIASQICRYLTHRDVMNLAACSPAMSAIMWSEVNWVQKMPRNPSGLYLDFTQLEKVFSKINPLLERIQEHRSEQVWAKERLKSCFYTDDDDLKYLKQLDIQRINNYVEVLKLEKCSGAFGLQFPPPPDLDVGMRLEGRTQARLAVPQRASSVPGRNKPDISTVLDFEFTDEEKANKSRRMELKYEIDLLRLKSLKNELDDASTTKADMYLIEGPRVGSRRPPPGGRFPCNCTDPVLHRCLHPGLRFGGGISHTEELWYRQSWEPRFLRNQRPVQLATNVKELEYLLWQAEHGGWDEELQHRVACIINSRIISPRFPRSEADSTIRYYWQSLETYSIECAYCHSNHDRLIEKAEKSRAQALRNWRSQQALLDEREWRETIVYMIERRQGTIECWGCNQVFCKSCIITVFVVHKSVPGGENIFRPLHPPHHWWSVPLNRRITGGWATHTLVCADCFLAFFTDRPVPTDLVKQVIFRKPNHVGEKPKEMKVHEIGCSWAMCWGRAPFLKTSEAEVHILLGRVPAPYPGKKAVLAGVCENWEVYGAGDLTVAMWRGSKGR